MTCASRTEVWRSLAIRRKFRLPPDPACLQLRKREHLAFRLEFGDAIEVTLRLADLAKVIIILDRTYLHVVHDAGPIETPVQCSGNDTGQCPKFRRGITQRSH